MVSPSLPYTPLLVTLLLTAVELLLLATVLSYMWLMEDERNFSGPSRSGTLPLPYRSFNLAVARSSACP